MFECSHFYMRQDAVRLDVDSLKRLKTSILRSLTKLQDDEIHCEAGLSKELKLLVFAAAFAVESFDFGGRAGFTR